MSTEDLRKVRVFISQPMSGYTEEQYLETRKEAEAEIDSYFANATSFTYEIVSTYYDKEAKDAEKMKYPKIYRLGHALMVLASCEYIYFAGNWKDKRSCVVEFIVSRMFGVYIIDKKNEVNVADIKITTSRERKYEY